jgi:hypothetical protein
LRGVIEAHVDRAVPRRNLPDRIDNERLFARGSDVAANPAHVRGARMNASAST